MNWAANAITALTNDDSVLLRPRGGSMHPKVKSGEEVRLEPLREYIPKKNDIVLVTVKGKTYLHLVLAVRKGQFKIGNNHGGVNGWVGINSIHGILTEKTVR